MKNFKFNGFVLIMLAMGILSYYGCKKEEDKTEPVATAKKGCMDKNALNYDSTATESDTCIYTNESLDQAAQEQEQLMSESLYLTSNTDNNVKDSDGGRLGSRYYSALNSCLFVDRDSISSKILKLYFGYDTLAKTYTNCVGEDGNSRRGMVRVQFEGKAFAAGAKLTFSLTEYHVNDTKIDLTLITTNNNFNGVERNFEIKGMSTLGSESGMAAIYTKTGEVMAGMKSNLTVTVLGGKSTPFDRSDDSIKIEGTGSGYIPKFGSFAMTMTNLKKKSGCIYIVRGTVDMTLTLAGTPVNVTMDYDPKDANVCNPPINDAGNEPCDSLVYVDIKSDFVKSTCEICDAAGSTDPDYVYTAPSGIKWPINCSYCKYEGCVQIGSQD